MNDTMETSNTTEYTVSIRVVFPEELTNILKKEKDRFVAEYGSSYKSDPHITVYLDRYTPEGFRELVLDLRKLQFEPFEISLLQPQAIVTTKLHHNFYIVDVSPKEPLEKLHAAVLCIASRYHSPLMRQREQKRFEQGLYSEEEWQEKLKFRAAGVPYLYDPHITLGDVALEKPQPNLSIVQRDLQQITGTTVLVTGVDVFFHKKELEEERATLLERVVVPFN